MTILILEGYKKTPSHPSPLVVKELERKSWLFINIISHYFVNVNYCFELWRKKHEM